MGLNWNEIKSRALLFSKTWDDACNENNLAKPFWIDFFEIFGITDKRVGTFELHVKKLGGKRGFMDLFWPGMLLVEHKSRGEDLDEALDQAIAYPCKTNADSHNLFAAMTIIDSNMFTYFMRRSIAPSPSHKPTTPQKTDVCKAWTNRPPAAAFAVHGSCPRSCGGCQTKSRSRLGGCCISR